MVGKSLISVKYELNKSWPAYPNVEKVTYIFITIFMFCYEFPYKVEFGNFTHFFFLSNRVEVTTL